MQRGHFSTPFLLDIVKYSTMHFEWKIWPHLGIILIFSASLKLSRHITQLSVLKTLTLFENSISCRLLIFIITGEGAAWICRFGWTIIFLLSLTLAVFCAFFLQHRIRMIAPKIRINAMINTVTTIITMTPEESDELTVAVPVEGVEVPDDPVESE